MAKEAQRAVILQPGALGDCILTLPLAKLMQEQLGLGGVDMYGSVEVKVLSMEPVAVYASQIDNQTQDPVMLPAQVIAVE